MKLRSVTAGMLATAMLATSAAPAAAQTYGGRGYGNNNGYNGYGYGNDRYRRHHDDGPSAGAVIGAVAVVGIIAAIAASASRQNRDRRAQQNGYANGNQNGYGDERAASDACASAAEQRAGRDARVTAIDAVDHFSDGYRVRGTIETHDYNSSRDRSSFTCTVRYGQVERVDLGGYAYNR